MDDDILTATKQFNDYFLRILKDPHKTQFSLLNKIKYRPRF